MDDRKCESILRRFYSPKVWNDQRSQTQHRLKLLDFWQIPSGARVLEIGCGQGDTLTALSFAVGDQGFVRGVDIAPENYGAPETLSQARKRILSCCGNVAIDLGFDVLAPDVHFEADSFDYLVLSHSLWYLPSYKTLCEILKRIRPWGKRLCLAEWDITEKAGFHQKAAWIQAVCACFTELEQVNIRTLLYPLDIQNALACSGWQILKEGRVSSPKLQDGFWEVQNTLELLPALEEDAFKMPPKLRRMLLSAMEELKNVPAVQITPLSAYCLCAEREEP